MRFSFIRLADYLIVNTMHMLSVNSIATLLNAFSTQLQMTPSIAAIQAWTTVLDEIQDVPELDEDEVRKCFKMFKMKKMIIVFKMTGHCAGTVQMREESESEIRK